MDNPHDLRNTVPIAGMMKPTKRKRRTSRAYSLDMFDGEVPAYLDDEELVSVRPGQVENITSEWLQRYATGRIVSTDTVSSGGDSD